MFVIKAIILERFLIKFQFAQLSSNVSIPLDEINLYLNFIYLCPPDGRLTQQPYKQGTSFLQGWAVIFEDAKGN